MAPLLKNLISNFFFTSLQVKFKTPIHIFCLLKTLLDNVSKQVKTFFIIGLNIFRHYYKELLHIYLLKKLDCLSDSVWRLLSQPVCPSSSSTNSNNYCFLCIIWSRLFTQTRSHRAFACTATQLTLIPQHQMLQSYFDYIYWRAWGFARVETRKRSRSVTGLRSCPGLWTREEAQAVTM